MAEVINVSQFILRRLNEIGAHHIFGVPGDFTLGFFNEVLKSNMKYIGTCNELNAAYAADGYARINGVGVCTTTYCVGELSAINGVAGAFAEDIPVVHIGGIPARKHLKSQPLLHHTLGDYMIPFKMYNLVTCASVILDDIDTLVNDVDTVLRELLLKHKPIYIGIPADIVKISLNLPAHFPFQFPITPRSNPEALEDCIQETIALIESSQKPILLPGVYLQRFHLVKFVKEIIEKTDIPYVTMMLSKCIIDEVNNRFIGLYCGERSLPSVLKCFTEADLLVAIGEKLTDFNTGGFSHKFPKNRVEVLLDKVVIRSHVYQEVYIKDFLEGLLKAAVIKNINKNYLIPVGSHDFVHRPSVHYEPCSNTKLTMHRFGDKLSRFFRPKSVVIADTGASMFTAVEILMPEDTVFVAQTFYGSIGYTVGATVGICAAVNGLRNVYLLIGDGSFQVTCQDISTMIRNNYRPIIFLVNNDGYSIERAIVDRTYNDILMWNYSEFVKTIGPCESFKVHTEEDLETVLGQAHDIATKSLVFIEIFIERWDFNNQLRCAGQGMAKVNDLLD